MKIDVQSIADIVPVDMVDNLIITIGWITAVDKWVWLSMGVAAINIVTTGHPAY